MVKLPQAGYLTHDLIDRWGEAHSSLEILGTFSFPQHLHSSLYRLKMNEEEEEELDTLALIPVELPLVHKPGAQNMPEGHLQTLFDTWRPIIEIEKQSNKDLGINWLIQVRDIPLPPSHGIRLMSM